MYDVIGGLLRLIIIFSLIKYIGYIALPIAEFLSTTFLIGYFLNKLMISKIELKGKEKLNFVFSGSTLLFIVFLISFIWIYFLTKINSWFLFVAYSILIALLNGIIILIFSKELKGMILKLFSRFTLSMK